MSRGSLFKAFKNYMAENYGHNHGKMLIHTGVVGWVLSAAAQVVAIVTNDEISNKQKMYLIPQELADAAVNIASFYLVTQSFKSVTSKLLNRGKLLRKPIRNFLEENKIQNVGQKGFDVLRDGKLTPEVKKDFLKFRDGVDFMATTAGSVLSCNILTPIIRNEIATNKQKSHMTKYSQYIDDGKPTFSGKNYLPKPTMQTFQTQATGLKI